MKKLLSFLVATSALLPASAWSGTCLYNTREFNAQVLAKARTQAAGITSCTFDDEVEGGARFNCVIHIQSHAPRFFSALALVNAPAGNTVNRNCRIVRFDLSPVQI